MVSATAMRGSASVAPSPNMALSKSRRMFPPRDRSVSLATDTMQRWTWRATGGGAGRNSRTGTRRRDHLTGSHCGSRGEVFQLLYPLGPALIGEYQIRT